ncbi:MAG TPA: helix-turn-helix domain-containing protein [Actinophytocola sp.]|uniref:TetR/AcrR family transcriptional regulator n=1 Tax=Actinophytocola sp. TaxID=1872138 RepID=UPI002DBA1B89|nr:helix-turn-helix domain-containing protein [Actinophytocola sp.]HEU5474472.1 helix-turn-helix domain-containing protein [Actinophytocola sp.]
MTARTPRRSPGSGERQRDPERTKARILDAAKAEFGARGFAAARISDIADRAGVNKQLISYYFGGKEGLYKELTTRWQRASGELSQSDLPLDAVLAGFVMSNLYERDWARLMVWSNLDTESSTPDEAADYGFMQTQVAELRRRQEAGELPDDLDPAYLFLALFAAACAGVTLPKVARMVCGADPDTPAFAERYADQLSRLVRHLHPS